MKATVALASLVVMIVACSSLAADWPQWQGPDRNAVSQEHGLLQEWPEGGPPLAWKATELGGGDAGPSIVDGRVFCMSYRGSEEVVWALSETDGEELWAKPIGAAFQQSWPQSKEGPSCTPTVDGERLYVLGVGGTLACLKVEDGEILWKRSLTEDFGGRIPRWSYRESPLIDGDKLICTPGGEEVTLAALNKMTGETIWTSHAPDSPEPAYASAIAIDFEGQHQYVQMTATSLVGVAASDGEFLWRFERPASGNGINCTTPIYVDGLVFCSAAYDAGGALGKLTKDADGKITVEEVWYSRNLQNHHGGVILLDGALYGANGGNSGGYLVCLDFKTGDVLWNERDSDKRRAPKGSLLLADGRFYYRVEDGTMLLLEPSSQEYIERGRFTQPDRTRLPAWAHPVVANGQLYIRDQGTLFCYNVKAE